MRKRETISGVPGPWGYGDGRSHGFLSPSSRTGNPDQGVLAFHGTQHFWRSPLVASHEASDTVV